MKTILITGGSGFIGTNLINELAKGYNIVNLDIKPPQEKSHLRYWKECDIVEKKAVLNLFKTSNPAIVIHLAAKTDTDSRCVLNDYLANTLGTQNILDAIKSVEGIHRTIITSSQFVNQYNGEPKHDEDFAPHTIYGESKVITEQKTRSAGLPCSWTIIRPTNIWGPWHPRYPKEFWYVLKKGRYLHPGKERVMRSYGYVGNVVNQITKILSLPEELISHQVIYVGDQSINLYDWVNEFSIQLTGKNVQVVPRIIVKAFALIGDLLKVSGIKFPLTSSRYKSMTESNLVSMEKTFKLLGNPIYTLGQGVDKTVLWLREQNPEFWS
jgi:nucleoside-diphosphate-sugar epimerase